MIEFRHLDIVDITPRHEMDINGNMMAFQLRDESVLTVSHLNGAAQLHNQDDEPLPVSLSETEYQYLKTMYEEEQ